MPLKILLADDHRMMREGLRAILERNPDWKVVGEAESGREAVQMAVRLTPDVIVMDVAMADLNGIEATRQILRSGSCRHVVALSSHSDRRYIRAILSAGAQGYVLKANAYAELERAVEAALQDKAYLCPDVTDSVIEAALNDGLPQASAYELLGPREIEVLQLVSEGLTSPEIARRLHLATSTIETHRRNLMRKLELHTIAELTRYAIREGVSSLVPSPVPPRSERG